mmetsp:Transcript_42120/g.98672  ORF Transcript_42120/g.98672 Transcript_42120/m.98672 type:complete len:235 (-) Transcript_42120:220-924(-)
MTASETESLAGGTFDMADNSAAPASCGCSVRMQASATAAASRTSTRCFGLSSSSRHASADSSRNVCQPCVRHAHSSAALIAALRSSDRRRSRSCCCMSSSSSTQPSPYVSLAAPYGLRRSTSGDMYKSVPQRECRRGDALSRRLDSPQHARPKSPSLTVRSFLVTKMFDDLKSRWRMPQSCTWRSVRQSVPRNESICTSVMGSSCLRQVSLSIRSPPAQNSITINTEQPPFSWR